MKLFASTLSIGAMAFVFWFNVNPQGATFCPTASDGTLKPYTVVRTNNEGELVTLSFEGASQKLWCDAVAGL